MTAPSASFKPRNAFSEDARYRLLPLRFGRLDAQRFVLTNDVGEYAVLSRSELRAFVDRNLARDSSVYKKLKSRHFLFDDSSRVALELLALKYRTRADRIAEFTGLHIFVVSLRCNHSCHYCQVSRQGEDRAKFDMSAEHAEKALLLTFRSPSKHLKIEFQGGEPLLNFPLVQTIVDRAKELNRTHHKNLQFVLATNLTRMTDEILDYCREQEILISTSLDGPKDLHDANRPLRDQSSYELTRDAIQRVRAVLGADSVSALMTTTPASLPRVEEIIDEYVAQGFQSIFLRSLSPYGFAIRTSLVRKYGVDDWLDFYKRGLSHILALNRRGFPFREEYTSVLLQKMFSPFGSGYVDLQSPAGIGIAGIVFNYDGGIYASDEGRMLAEMGDTTFRMGHLDHDSYESAMTSEALLGPLEQTVLESSPMCTDCPFLPYCGADPVGHKATRGDVVGHKAFSAFCKKQMGVLKHLLGLLEDDPSAREILTSWV